jgi:hypothetical protein
MAANKLKPARKKSASPAGAKKKARGKKPKAQDKRATAKKNGAHAAPPPAANVARPVEPEAPIPPPVLPTPTATFTF